MTTFTGNSVEEAIATGLEQLGISRAKADITVLSKGSKGFLGFGKKLAQVKIVELKTQPKVSAVPAQPEVEVEEPAPTVEEKDLAGDEPSSELVDEKSVEPVEEKTTEPAQHQNFNDEFEAFMAQEAAGSDGEEEEEEEEEEVEEVVSETDQEPEVVSETSKARPSLDEAAEAVLTYLDNIIREMDIEAKLSAQTSRRQVTLQIETPEAGRLIGYHGKVLKSLQLVGQNFLHDRFSRNFNLSLNVNDYLEHRTEALVDLANRVARRVQESGRAHRMEPMTSSERKLVHKTVAQFSGVESYSEGEDPNRYVVVVNRDNY